MDNHVVHLGKPPANESFSTLGAQLGENMPRRIEDIQLGKMLGRKSSSKPHLEVDCSTMELIVYRSSS